MHQPPSTKGITCYGVGTSTLHLNLYEMIICMQADLSKKENQIADLQENLKSQQAKASKAKNDLTSTLRVNNTYLKYQAHNKLSTWHLGANAYFFLSKISCKSQAQFKYYSWHLGANAYLLTLQIWISSINRLGGQLVYKNDSANSLHFIG